MVKRWRKEVEKKEGREKGYFGGVHLSPNERKFQ
jgi:hypothetical protein